MNLEQIKKESAGIVGNMMRRGLVSIKPLPRPGRAPAKNLYRKGEFQTLVLDCLSRSSEPVSAADLTNEIQRWPRYELRDRSTLRRQVAEVLVRLGAAGRAIEAGLQRRSGPPAKLWRAAR